MNPFRYRGYYYDVETGLYYLNSRYYDPETGRFISADDINYLDPESINGLNLYAYCGNNPIMRVDPNGHKWYHWVIGGLIVAGIATALVLSAGSGFLALNALMMAANGMTVASATTTILAYAAIGTVVGGIAGV